MTSLVLFSPLPIVSPTSYKQKSAHAATATISSNTSAPQTIKMKHLAAYLLLGLGGNTSPSAADVKKVLESVGIEADDERLEKLISELEGKDINEVRPTPLSG